MTDLHENAGDEVLEDVLRGEGDRDPADTECADERADAHPEEVQGIDTAHRHDHDADLVGQPLDSADYFVVVLAVEGQCLCLVLILLRRCRGGQLQAQREREAVPLRSMTCRCAARAGRAVLRMGGPRPERAGRAGGRPPPRLSGGARKISLISRASSEDR